MKINSYNPKDEEKHSEVIKILKSLPKVKADENFEFNLMTRIQNRSFEMSIPEQRSYFRRFFVPASAFATSLVILFFIVNDSGVGVENPFLADPPVRQDYSTAHVDTIEMQGARFSSTAGAKGRSTTEQPVNQTSGLVRVVVEPSDAVTVEEVDLPFSDENSVDLDSYVSGETGQRRPTLNRGALVSGGNNYSRFDGFLIRERPSKKTIESHKARLDSVKKSQKR